MSRPVLYGVTDTRGALYAKPLRYSDYAFTDRRIIARSFAVPAVAVSDHLPLIIDAD